MQYLHLHLRAGADSCDAANCRQLVDIVWGCLAMIFASTWVAVHPNVPAPGQSWLRLTLRRLGIMLITIVAPELIVFFAARQLALGGHPITTLEQLEDPLLGPAYLADIRAVEAEEIADRSKGDALSKGTALLQGLWFITQIAARFVRRLPISELEIATLAYAVVNVFTRVLWWAKPLDVKQPIRIGPAREDFYLLPCGPDRVPTPAAGGGGPVFDLGRELEEMMHEDRDPMLIGPAGDRRAADVKLPYTAIPPAPAEGLAAQRLSERHRKSETFFWGPIQGAYANYRPRLSTSVPEFWSSPDIPHTSPFGAMLVGSVFGAIHCAAWGAAFPSEAERVLWRTSAVLVAAYPASLAIPHALGEYLCAGHVHDHVPVLVQVLGIAAYVFARMVLIVLVFSTLRAPDAGWFIAVDWTVHLPHLGIST
ncbi:hypothetical protein FB451DRAFT_1519683 [Mycena latifolia]|nr:hypothetical protein FB451DRAFT_1519683 [Mycena latifolia]